MLNLFFFCHLATKMYFFKVNNRKTSRKRCVNIVKVNNKNIRTTDVVLIFLLLTLNIFHTFICFFILDFEQVNVSWANNDRKIDELTWKETKTCFLDIVA